MIPFTLVALLITAIALILMVLPLLRTRNTISYERQAQNIHYAKERLNELEEQLKNASISATDYEALKLEIEATLAHDIELSKEQGNGVVAPQRSNKLTILLLCACLPVAAAGFYLLTGTPESLNLQTAVDQPSGEQINNMVATIEKRLAEKPNDPEGWAILSRTYLSLRRYRDAAAGYKKLIEVGGESATAYASLADATALMAGGNMVGEPMTYAKKALSIDPDNRQALWLAGLGASQLGDAKQTRQLWGRLLPLLDSLPEQQQELREIIAQTFNDQSASELTINPTNSAESSAPPNAPSSGLTINVQLAPEQRSQTQPQDLVFVFARAQQGPPAPLAVKRLTVADLPMTVTLDDSNAMVPQFKLSLFEDVLVSARVARSGNPVAQTGDIQSAVVETKNNAKGEIQLIISDTVQ